ncbi:MAG: PQQ-binding-like beta-propeller repeat protein [Thermoguttaceae bacterium]|jgi:outer membrane protein assembly factor BamB|nr:PQQ-binding-like beta-propeller repeat protein [Thermoguttaceae bacterium]
MRRKPVITLIVCLGLAVLVAVAIAQRPGTKKSGTKPPTVRNWTDASGQHKTRAALEAVENGTVRLRKENGTLVELPIEKLSEADQRWIERNAKSLAAKEAASPSSVVSGGDWPGFRGPNRDGKSPDTGLLKEWPEGGPKLLWKVSTLGQGYSSPAVAGGTIYITGDADGRLILYAFDLDGKLKWQTEHGPAWTGDHPGSRATPTVDGDRLYLLSGVGLIGAFDTKTGRRLWARDAKEFGGRPGGWGYAESVLVLGNLAIFKPGEQNCIVALDKTSGRDVWASRGFSAGPEYSSCLAFVHNGIPMIATGTREGIVCVNPKNGALLWGNKFSAGNVANCPTPAYSDGYVFWANGYGKGGICLKLGRAGEASEAWTTRDMVCHHGGYVIHEGYIYGNDGDGWACLDLKTGQRKWKDRGVGKGSLCWADGMLYLFSENRGQAALATCSPERLEIKGRVRVEGEGPSWAHPVVIGGRLYLRYAQNLYCFDVKGG